MLLSQSPQQFRSGTVWTVMTDINSALKVISSSLLVLFFIYGIARSSVDIEQMKRPSFIIKSFLRLALCEGLSFYGMELMMSFIEIIHGISTRIIASSRLFEATQLSVPETVCLAVSSLGTMESIPLWFVSLLGSLFIWVCSFVMILNVYGRFFRLYLYTSIAPLPIACFASAETSFIGRSFILSYIGVLLEEVMITVGCIIFTSVATIVPQPDTGSSAVAMLWSYIGEILFNMLMLTGTVKMSERVVKDMLGL